MSSKSLAVTAVRVPVGSLAIRANWDEAHAAERTSSVALGIQPSVRTGSSLFVSPDRASASSLAKRPLDISGNSLAQPDECDLTGGARAATILEGTLVVMTFASSLSRARAAVATGSEGAVYEMPAALGMTGRARTPIVETSDGVSVTPARNFCKMEAQTATVDASFGVVVSAGRPEAASSAEDVVAGGHYTFQASSADLEAVARDAGIAADATAPGRATAAFYTLLPSVSLGTAVEVSAGRAEAEATGSQYTESASISAGQCDLAAAAHVPVVNGGYTYVEGIWGPMNLSGLLSCDVVLRGTLHGDMATSSQLSAELEDAGALDSPIYSGGIEAPGEVEEVTAPIRRGGGVAIREL